MSKLLACMFWLPLTFAATGPFIYGLDSRNTTSKDVADEDSRLISQLEKIRLLDQDGHPLRMDRIRNRVVLLNFIFTSCDTSCPTQTDALSTLQRYLPRSVQSNVFFISISVDADHDNPERLHSFALAHHADLSNWSFVTAAREQSQQLNKAFDVFRVSALQSQSGQHTTDIRLFSRDGRMLQRYSGFPLDTFRLHSELMTIVSAMN